VRLLLDEHLSPHIAEGLRARGHDVVALVERLELRSAGDEGVLVAATGEGRALVTADTDFVTLARRASAAGDHHSGIVLVSRGLLLARRPIGPMIAGLDDLLRRLPGEHALADRVVWLESP